jgi:hypothetical protein
VGKALGNCDAPPTAREYLAVLENSLLAMGQTIEDLLTLTEAQRGSPAFEDTPLEPLVTRALEGLPPEARRRVRPSGAWPQVWGRAAWLEKAWLVLLQAGLKGLPPASSLAIGADLLPGEPHRVRCWLDFGPAGLPPEMRASLESHLLGSDLPPMAEVGLVLARGLLQAHQAAVTLEGARLSFDLPAAAP